MNVGTVKWFDSKKGFGFIQRQDGRGDIFVHASALQEARLPSLAEGDVVEFEEKAERGKIAAVNLRLVEKTQMTR